jgi:hypothetical protein
MRGRRLPPKKLNLAAIKQVKTRGMSNHAAAVKARNVAVTHRAILLWDTMIGKKVVMAATGAVLVAFVIAHMLGNLKAFSGAREINAYSRFLREAARRSLAMDNCCGS